VIVEDMPHSLPWYPRHHRTTLGLIERYLGQTCGLATKSADSRQANASAE
jgi:hypothetical protein